jgi:hypothetical protein
MNKLSFNFFFLIFRARDIVRQVHGTLEQISDKIAPVMDISYCFINEIYKAKLSAKR